MVWSEEREGTMKRLLVRYEVAPDKVADNEREIEAVFAQLARDRPEGLRYASFRLPDGVSFLHLASIETPDGSNPLLAIDAFARFTRALRERCVAPPVVVDLTEIGAYRMLADPVLG